MDVVREGEAVWADGGYASAQGTILGLWHPLLQGGKIIADEKRLDQGQIFIGGASLASDIAQHQPAESVLEEGARAMYCFDGTMHLIPPAAAHALQSTWKLTVCPCHLHAATGRILSLGLPDSPPPTRTADAQPGRKPGTCGRLIPGYKVERLTDALLLTSPDGVTISLPGGKLDAEDFLTLS
jgi:hypothetical protein